MMKPMKGCHESRGRGRHGLHRHLRVHQPQRVMLMGIYSHPLTLLQEEQPPGALLQHQRVARHFSPSAATPPSTSFSNTVSGSKWERFGLKKALSCMRAGDTLIVTRLDRSLCCKPHVLSMTTGAHLHYTGSSQEQPVLP